MGFAVKMRLEIKYKTHPSGYPQCCEMKVLKLTEDSIFGMLTGGRIKLSTFNVYWPGMYVTLQKKYCDIKELPAGLIKERRKR